MSISKKLVIPIVSASLLIAIAVSLVEIYLSYRAQMEKFDSRLEEIRAHDTPALASAIWHSDKEQTITYSHHLVEDPVITAVEVLRQGDAKPIASWHKDGVIPKANVIKTFPLTYTVNHKPEAVGLLRIYANFAQVDRDLRSMTRLLFIGVLVHSLLLALIIMAATQRLVTRPLQFLNQRSQGSSSSRLNQGETHMTRPDWWGSQAYEFERLLSTMEAIKQDAAKAIEAHTKELALKDQLNEHIRKLSHAKAIAEVSTGIFHDLVNIIGGAKLVMSRLRRPPPASHDEAMQKQILQDGLLKLEKGYDLMTDIVRSQQKLASDELELEEIPLAPLIHDALLMEEYALERANIRVTQAVVPTDLTIAGSRPLVLSVLINILKNAMEAIQTRVNDDAEAPRSIDILAFHAGGRAQLMMKDSGVGFDSETQKRIATHGFTTKVEGHGFGLHSVVRYLEDMNATFHIASPGFQQGATVTLSFPYVKQAKEKSAAQP